MTLDPTNSPVAFWQMARAMATHAARAYSDHTVCDPATNAQALVFLDSDGDIIIAFKGSSAPKDFLEDARILRDTIMEASGGKVEVHAGFHADFAAIHVAVLAAVRSQLAIQPAAKIYVTGHSLGGALAILCALEFSRQGLPIAAVFTFGQPRVGNKNFAVLYDDGLRDITFRIVNQNDIVPRTPGWLLGYRHCGQEIFLEPKPYGGTCVNPAMCFKLLSAALGLYAAYRTRQDVLVSEHFIAAYQARINTL